MRVDSARELASLAAEHLALVEKQEALYARALEIIGGDPERLRMFAEALAGLRPSPTRR